MLTPLAPPHRLDLTARALGGALVSLLTRRERAARKALEDTWGGPAFLSVRSGLCALFASSGWAKGSEVLVSALTISDIPKIIEAHGFVPVAVDVDPRTLQPSLDDIARKTNLRTKAILVAHLFGARIDASQVRAIARFAHVHGMLLLEDCAQAYVGPAWRGDPEADVSMFSFGTLKTGTALGGALFTVRDDALRARLAAVEKGWPRQRTRAFAEKVLKAALFLVAQHPRVYGLIAALLAASGSSIGEALRKATRGFPANDTNELLGKLRQRPCPAQLAFLQRRLATFDVARLDARSAVADALVHRWRHDDRVAGGAAQLRTHWIFGVRSRDPARLREALVAHGIDASGASNITAVGHAREAPQARALVDELVFVPVYPELDAQLLRDLVNVVEACEAGELLVHDATAELAAAE
jgi:perosamine synthetase